MSGRRPAWADAPASASQPSVLGPSVSSLLPSSPGLSVSAPFLVSLKSRSVSVSKSLPPFLTMETDFNSDLIQTITNRRRKPQAWNPCAVPSCEAGLPLTGPRRSGPHAETRSRRGRTRRWASGSEVHVIPAALRMDPATPLRLWGCTSSPCSPFMRQAVAGFYGDQTPAGEGAVRGWEGSLGAGDPP